MSFISKIEKGWHRKEGAEPHQIAVVEQEFNIVFPDDYKEFLHWSNGGEGQIGSAYFLFWSIENISKRNKSAFITKYMSEKFLAIGTNGGDECYALDYTGNTSNPQFAIVPLGDLDHESKFIISSSITEAIEKSIQGKFSDLEYYSQENTELSQEVKEIMHSNVRIEAENAWRERKYPVFIYLLEGIKGNLSDTELKKLLYAKKKI